MTSERFAGDVDSLVEEIERAVRDTLGERMRTENIDDMVNRVSEAVRNAVSGDKAHDFGSVEREVRRAVRDAVGDEGLGEDTETLADWITKAVRTSYNRGSELAGSVGQSLKDRIQTMVGGVRGTGRDGVVMVRVNQESMERIDELIEAGLVGSRSEAAAYLIAEGIKARQGLFDGISSKIEAIRKAREELQRLLNEEDAPPHLAFISDNNESPITKFGGEKCRPQSASDRTDSSTATGAEWQVQTRQLMRCQRLLQRRLWRTHKSPSIMPRGGMALPQRTPIILLTQFEAKGLR